MMKQPSFFIILTHLCIVSGLFSQQAIPTVAVLEFQSEGTLKKNEVHTITERFRAEMVRTRLFKVLERDKMKEILTEQDFTSSDLCNTSECIVQIGQLLGVQYMFAGNIGRIGEIYAIDIRMICVETGIVTQTISRNYPGKIDGLLNEMRVITVDLAKIFLKKIASDESDQISYTTEGKAQGGGPLNAALSIFVPGLGGYFVEKNKWRPAVTTISCLGLIGYGIAQKNKSNDYYADYQSTADLDSRHSLYKKANKAHHRYFIATRIAGAIWIADILYVAYKGEQNRKNKSLSVIYKANKGFTFNITMSSVELGYKLNF